MDLVVDEVMEFQHVDIAHRRFLLERLTGPAVEELCLAVARKIGIFQNLIDVFLARTIKNWRDGLEAEDLSCPSQMGLENLPHVHPAWNTERVEQNLKRGAVGEEWHLLLRKDIRDHTLVAVPAGHLVAHGDYPLGCDVDLDHLEHARPQLVAPLHAVEPALTGVDGTLNGRPHRFDDLVDIGLPLRRTDVEFVRLEGGGPLGDDLVVLVADHWTAIGSQ